MIVKSFITYGPGLYCLPRLQEMVVPVATANIMSPHDVPKQEQKQKHYLGIAIYLDQGILKGEVSLYH